jgi:hypothetical protein
MQVRLVLLSAFSLNFLFAEPEVHEERLARELTVSAEHVVRVVVCANGLLCFRNVSVHDIRMLELSSGVLSQLQTFYCACFLELDAEFIFCDAHWHKFDENVSAHRALDV